MGGTSTDVAHFDGEYERAFETEVAGVRMRAPMMLIHTVAAGGGSILHFDGARFRVGPGFGRRRSRPALLPPRRAARRHRRQCHAGQADPRFLSRRSSGPSQDQPLDAERRPRRRSPRWPREIGDGRSPEQVADGFIPIAVANMAEAIKKISVARGYDVTRYALNCFGGAGGQHACLVADALAMTTVLIHPLSSLLSAYGMGLADIRAHAGRRVEEPLDDDALARIARAGRAARRSKRVAEVAAQGVAARRHRRSSRARTLRYAGSDTALPRSTARPTRRRHAARLRGRAQGAVRLHRSTTKALVVEAIEVEAVGGGAQFDERAAAGSASGAADAAAARRGSSRKAHGATPQSSCATQLGAGHGVAGPGAHHRAAPDRSSSRTAGAPRSRASDHVVLRARRRRAPRRAAVGTKADPVMLEIFNNLFMSIAEQMGVTLQNTAYSVNIKERLDFSCAVFDRDGSLVANAPHMPVHLGSMDRSVETIIRLNAGRIRAGRRLRAQRALQWRHASARHHRLHAGVRRRAARQSCSGSPRAAITPTSAASRRAR